MRGTESLTCMGLKFRASTLSRAFPPFIERRGARLEWSLQGCGGPGFFLRVRGFLGRRFGLLTIRGANFTHVGMGLPQAKRFRATSNPCRTLRRFGPLASALPRWRRFADVNASWANLISCDGVAPGFMLPAPDVNFLQVRDIYRINDLIKTLENWQQTTAFKYCPGLHLKTYFC